MGIRENTVDSINYIEFVENLIGSDLELDNAKRLNSLKNNELEGIRESYHQSFHFFLQNGGNSFLNEGYLSAPAPYSFKSKSSGEYSPLIHGKFDSQADILGGDSLYPWLNESIECKLIHIKVMLNYCHRLVIPDPLFYILQFFDGASGATEYGEIKIKESRMALISYLNFLYLIKGLVKADIISFYPQYEHSFPYSGMKEHISLEHETFFEWLEENKVNDIQGIDNHLLSIKHSEVITKLLLNQRFNVDLFIDSQSSERAIAHTIDYYKTNFLQIDKGLGDKSVIDNAKGLRRIIDFRFPDLSTLSWEDIIAIRTTSTQFNEYRNCLKKGILRIEECTNDSSELIFNAISEELQSGYRAIQKEKAGSKFLSHIPDTVPFAIGYCALNYFGVEMDKMIPISSALGLLGYRAMTSIKSGTKVNSLSKHYGIWL
jgi:hypothetical protein